MYVRLWYPSLLVDPMPRDRRHCNRCGIRVGLYGYYNDLDSEYHGSCRICFAEWRSWYRLRRCRCCNHDFSVTSPVLCALGLDFHLAMKIQSFIYVEDVLLDTVLMRDHKKGMRFWNGRALARIGIMSLVPTDVLPSMETLRQTAVLSDDVARSCFHPLRT